MALNKKHFDALRSTKMLSAMARYLGCSVSTVRMMRWRKGYGTRSDGRLRVEKANKWLLKKAAAAGLMVLLFVACTTPTTPAPVCKQFGFSPTTGRDSSWVVSCHNQSAFSARRL